MSLPRHGKLECRLCFLDDREVHESASWRVRNDPGAWGSDNPLILVLGFSKGATQADIYQTGKFEDVPFADCRDRLSELLRAVGLLETGQKIDERFGPNEKTFAFGSLVRCSLARLNKAEKFVTSGEIMPKAFSEIVPRRFISNCTRQFLGHLPDRLRLIVLLGTTDAYVRGCAETIRELYPHDSRMINDVAYQAGSRTWVHISHPSPLNGHHRTWVEGGPETTAGSKRLMAVNAIKQALRLTG